MPEADQVAITMDWGGTWARASVVDQQGQILWSSRHANAEDSSREQMVRNATALIRQAINQAGTRPISGIGVALAGPVDTETGIIHDPPNLPALNGLAVRPLWEPEFGLPVQVGNDATLAAMGEFHFGAGRDFADRHGVAPTTLVYVTVSTGIGGGVVDRGRPFLGAHGLAGEVGHQVIDISPTAPVCLCGSSGCLEILASGTAIARIARQRLKEAGRSGFAGQSVPLEELTAQNVFEGAEAGDVLARDLLDDVVHALSVGLLNALHLYNPDLMVLGGGVTNGLKQLNLIERIESQMLARAMSQRHKDVILVASNLGDAVGMIGAASMVFQAAESSAP